MRNLKIFTLAMSVGLLFIGIVPFARASMEDQEMTATFKYPVKIPGKVLTPGAYIFRLVNPDVDRSDFVVINAKTDDAIEIVSGVPIYRVETTSDAKILLDKNNAKDVPETLHAWFYPDRHEGVEFVYPNHE